MQAAAVGLGGPCPALQGRHPKSPQRGWGLQHHLGKGSRVPSASQQSLPSSQTAC